MSALLGGIISGALGVFGANKAAKAQERASREQVALARETRDMTRADLAPWKDSGVTAQNALLYEMGLGAAPMIGGSTPQVEEYTRRTEQTPNHLFGTRGDNFNAGAGISSTPVMGYRVGGQEFDTREAADAWAADNAVGATKYGGITMSPAGQFALEQGRGTIEAGAAGRGGLYSGSALKGLEDYRFGLAAQDRENQLGRLMNVSSMGQAAAGGQASANQNYSSMAGGAIGARGNAQAAGIVGGVNAINSGIQNYLGYQQMSQLLQPQAQQGTNWFGGMW